MSPLLAAPNRGYADWQRVGNYDTGDLWVLPLQVLNTSVASPLMDMSRSGYIGGMFALSAGQAHVQVNWSADIAKTIGLGARQFNMDANMGFECQLRLPNLGPYCQAQLFPIAGAGYTAAATIIGTDRVHQLEMIPSDPILITQDGAALGASATVKVYSLDYFSGPANVYFLSPVLATVQFEWLDGNGNWHVFDEVPVAAGQPSREVIVTPAGAWRASVFNTTAGASTFSLFVTPSLTGAS